MDAFKLMKDGGPLSRTWGFFLIECKWLFSIVLLRFEEGSREAYHTHAFNAVSWVLWGTLVEHELGARRNNVYRPSLRPIITPRTCFHRVSSVGRTWAITFRGPWLSHWHEYLPKENKYITLTKHRAVVA